MRTVVECTSHIEFVLAGFEKGEIKSDQKKLLDAYFSDFHRNDVRDFKRLPLRQGDVHKVVGNDTDEKVGRLQGAERFNGVDISQLMSNVYMTYSNYVHSKYPEVMDMYGGSPPHFYLIGMSNTSKDDENRQVLECFIQTVSDALRLMIYKFEMINSLRERPRLIDWCRRANTQP